MRVKKSFFLLPLLLALIASLCWAHPGGTDADGGHWDDNNVSGLGRYHYHHGYPAHLHRGGECPYDFDDKTGQWGGGTSTSSSEESPSEESFETKNPAVDFNLILLSFFVCYILYFVLIILTALLLKLIFSDPLTFTFFDRYPRLSFVCPLIVGDIIYLLMRAFGYHIHWSGYLLYFLGLLLIYFFIGYSCSSIRHIQPRSLLDVEKIRKTKQRIYIFFTIIITVGIWALYCCGCPAVVLKIPILLGIGYVVYRLFKQAISSQVELPQAFLIVVLLSIMLILVLTFFY